MFVRFLKRKKMFLTGLPKVQVSSVAVLGILDHFMRREDDSLPENESNQVGFGLKKNQVEETPVEVNHVIGTLMGYIKDGVVHVHSSFAVQYTEKGDELHLPEEDWKSVAQLHTAIYPDHCVVGWYSTGSHAFKHSALINEFYTKEYTSLTYPVHLLVDTNLLVKNKVKVFYGLSNRGDRSGVTFTPANWSWESFGQEKLAGNLVVDFSGCITICKTCKISIN